MDEPKYKWAYQYKAGHPINSIQCLIAEGLFRDEEEIASSPSQDIYATTYPIRPGDVKYRDLNDDKIIDDNDMCWTGNPTVPEIIYGFGFSLKYKGFDCSAFFQGQGKVSILMYNYHPFATAATPGSGLMQWIADEHWSEDDPNPKALYPRLSPLWNNNNTKASTLYVRNGKMLRLKTAEIGYTYKKMRVYVSGTNLLTFAPFKYWDPEKGSGNGLGYRSSGRTTSDSSSISNPNTAKDHEKDNLRTFTAAAMLLLLPRRGARRQSHRRGYLENGGAGRELPLLHADLHAQPDRVRLVARPVRPATTSSPERAARPTIFRARACSTARRTPT